MISSENKNFTASDIERYHSGQMSVQERHALEKAALDDPFLADALEGYAFTSTPAADIAKIKARLDEKLDRKKVVPFFKRYQWLSAAAVFIIVAGAAWFAYNNFNNEKTSVATVPLEKQQEQISEPGKIVERNLADTNNSSVSNNVVLTPPKSKTNSGTFETYKKVEALQSTFPPIDEKKQEEKTGVNIDPLLSRSRTNQVRNNNITRNYGTVERNAIPNINRNVTPDPNANYRNSQVSPQVNQVFRQNNDSFRNDVTYYREQNKKPVQPDTVKNFDVVLQEDKTGLNEVVVINKDAEQKKTDRYPKVTIDTLEPAGGYVKFDDYVMANLKMPDELKDKPVGGEVELSFDVDKKGHPTNITVIKSLCEKCDEEAIRVLKEGPKWKKKKNKKGKITIKF